MAPPIVWLSDKIEWKDANDADFVYKIVDFYTKFKFKNIVAEIGDFVLISNADATDPDSVEGCDIGQIIKLYQSHDKDLCDKHRAHVQWYCKLKDIPVSCSKNFDISLDNDLEIVEDHRPFDKDVSIETFYKKCQVLKVPTTAIIKEAEKSLSPNVLTFLCRFRISCLSKRKYVLEPVLDDERKEFACSHLLKTPQKKNMGRNKTSALSSITDVIVSTKLYESNKTLLKHGSSEINSMKDITNSFGVQSPMPTNTNEFSHSFNCHNENNSINKSPSKWKSLKNEKQYYSPDRLVRSENYSRVLNRKVISKELTPKSQRKKVEENIDNSDDDFVLSTPKKEKYLKAKKSRKSLGKYLDVASIDVRKNPILVSEGNLKTARERLHVSSVPLSLPCREEEFNNIYTFVENKIIENIGGCMYISGVPGTGKTATVTEVIRCLTKLVKQNELPKFDFIEINGMRLSEPRQAYVAIYKQLTGKTVLWEQAYNLLEARFTKPAPRRCTTVLLVDELDILCNKRQDVLYNLLDWPSKNAAHLVVIAIANTMDLPERFLMGRVASRLGLTRLTFQPYTFVQLQSIVNARLLDTGAFNNDALQLVARKVAAVSGDARRALDICRRAVELAELSETHSGKLQQVSLSHVNQALTEMITSSKVQAVKTCSKIEKLFLQAIVAEVQRTGIEETTFCNVYRQLETICAFINIKVPSITNTLRICCHLSSYKLLITDNCKNDINQKVLLNVSSDDIHYATQAILM